MFELEAELSDLLGRKVDLNTIGFLGPEFRERIRREARDLHVAS
jgi:predicted nucleotidyltransferase